MTKRQELIDAGDLCQKCNVFIDDAQGVPRLCEACKEKEARNWSACERCGQKNLGWTRCPLCFWPN